MSVAFFEVECRGRNVLVFSERKHGSMNTTYQIRDPAEALAYLRHEVLGPRYLEISGAALEALQSWGRAQRVMLLVMVDRGHRELPIQPDFCGRVVPTRRSESIELRLSDVDGEEGVFLRRFTPPG